MSEFVTTNGETLHLVQMDAKETRRLVRQFGKACKRNRKQAMVETFDALFDYCAQNGIVGDPPDDDLGELGAILGLADRAAWLRFEILVDEVECVGLVAAVLAGTLGIDAADLRDFRAGIERLGVGQ